MVASVIKPNRFPEVFIKSDVYSKLEAYADLCDSEISALGSVQIVDDRILIEDIFLFEQVVTGSSTDLSSEDISKFMCDYVRKGKDPSTLKFWWHSHVNMGVFWSSTDNATIDRFTSDWMISMVSNKKKEFKLRVDIFSPFRVVMDDLPLNIEYYDKSMNHIIKKEIDAKVKHQFFPDMRSLMSPQLQPLRYPSDNVKPFDGNPPMGNTYNKISDTYREPLPATPVLQNPPEISPKPNTVEVDLKNNKITDYPPDKPEPIRWKDKSIISTIKYVITGRW